MRIAANRINIADAMLDERRTWIVPSRTGCAPPSRATLTPADAERLWATLHADRRCEPAAVAAHDRDARRRIAYYETLLAESPTRSTEERRVPRQILAFDPERASLIELSGDLDRARRSGGTGAGPEHDVRRLGRRRGHRPPIRRGLRRKRRDDHLPRWTRSRPASCSPAWPMRPIARYALEMAPRLVAFSEDVERRAGDRPVTYVGHSYGGLDRRHRGTVRADRRPGGLRRGGGRRCGRARSQRLA